MLISPNKILPSQDFLKENTVRYILACIRDGRTEDLPPTPLVRRDASGNFVAIDGHNLIAVRQFRNEQVEVLVASSAQGGLPEISQANIKRNKELAQKYDTVLNEQRRVATAGTTSFDDLVAKYQSLFAETS